MLACAFVPILKSMKYPAKIESYRAIAASSLILKLFDYVILTLLNSDSLQFGFKEGSSTTQCTWLFCEIATDYLKNRNLVIKTLLDCTKAFDLCEFSTLFLKLLKRSVPKIVVRILIFVNTEQEVWVRWGSSNSEPFRVRN